jgi:hypothetical protein
VADGISIVVESRILSLFFRYSLYRDMPKVFMVWPFTDNIGSTTIDASNFTIGLFFQGTIMKLLPHLPGKK